MRSGESFTARLTGICRVTVTERLSGRHMVFSAWLFPAGEGAGGTVLGRLAERGLTSFARRSVPLVQGITIQRGTTYVMCSFHTDEEAMEG